MIPVLFSFGPIHLYSYGLLNALGILVSIFLIKRFTAADNVPSPDDVVDIIIALILWGFLGARLLYIAQNLSYYLENPLKILAVWEGGLIFYGGAVSCIIGLLVTVRYKKLPFWKCLDFLVPYIALTQFFGRIGCFLNGCCYGKACDLPWAVHFPQTQGPVHPAQLYEAFYALVLFFYLRARSQRVKFEGEIGLLYFILYGFGRYLIEFVREPGLSWFGLTYNQWISIGFIAVSFIWFQARRRSSKKRS